MVVENQTEPAESQRSTKLTPDHSGPLASDQSPKPAWSVTDSDLLLSATPASRLSCLGKFSTARDALHWHFVSLGYRESEKNIPDPFGDP